MKKRKLHADEALSWAEDILSQFKASQLVNVEITKYVPKKTQAQLGLYWLAIGFYAEQAGYDTEREVKMLHKGIEQKYAMKKRTGVYDENGIEIKAPIPLSECDRLDEFQCYFEGVFREAASHVPSIDMSEFVIEWTEIREERLKRERELKK